MTGEELKTIRNSLGLTQRRLAELVGVSETTIGRYEMKANVDGRYKVPHWLAREMRRLAADPEMCRIELPDKEAG